MQNNTNTRPIRHQLIVCAVLVAAVVAGTSLASILSVHLPFTAHFLQRPSTEREATPRLKSIQTISARQQRLEARLKKLALDAVIKQSTIVFFTADPKAPIPEHLKQAAPATERDAGEFPSFGRTVHPVRRIPEWGAMKTPGQWNRAFNQLKPRDFVAVPAYNLDILTIPLSTLLKKRDDAFSIQAITSKLYYSTRHFGAYDLDSAEFKAVHPGIDLKLAKGTPIHSIAGGRVHTIREQEKGLGLHVIIEHRIGAETYYSIYGHLGDVEVETGQTVDAGTIVGEVGMTGNTSAPHLHLQVDRGQPYEAQHTIYWPTSLPRVEEAEKFTVHPMRFIERFESIDE